MTRHIGIYVHIPFCVQKCKYCSFTSVCQNNDLEKKYFVRLNEQIDAENCNKKVSSIFFGGGTPSAVDPSQLCQTLCRIKKKFCVDKNAEITLEANPGTVSQKSLEKYLNEGFNRISFGAQSFEDQTLKKLGRVHSKAQIFQAVELAKNAGFENIGLDIILGTGGIDAKNFEASVLQAKKMGVTHFSAYILQLERGTRLFEEVRAGKTRVSSEEETTWEYAFVQKTLKKFGYLQYEISNFALPGFSSKHNKNYWNLGEYLGFGVAAHSHISGVRAENSASFEDFFCLPFEKQKQNVEVLATQQIVEEYIMLALRTTKGLSQKRLLRLGVDLMMQKQSQIQKLVGAKMLNVRGDRIFIPPKFFAVSNAIILELI